MKYFFDKDNISESDRKKIMQISDDIQFEKISHALEEVDLNGEEKDTDEKDDKEKNKDKKNEEKSEEVNNSQKKKNNKKKKKK